MSTAPALANGSSMVANNSVAQRAAEAPRSRRPQAWTSASTPSMASHDGRRTASSDRPNRRMESACAQNARGGLPQNGTPGSNHGVIQSPDCAISRAISA